MMDRPESVSYFLHEAEVARSELHAKRWMIAALITFLALVGTNVGWIIYESMYVDEYNATQTVTQEGGDSSGTNTFTVGDFYGGGDGKANSNTNSK